MEVKNKKVIQIPIANYEEDMNTESSKEKKNEILDLFQNYNNLHAEQELKEVENKLHDACKEGDLELIQIYLNEQIENESKDLIFKIDKTKKTASLFKVNNDIEDLIIPRTIKHESINYLITSICGSIYSIKNIKFEKDSSVKTIYKHAFSISEIEVICFPSSLKELKEGWCCGTKELKKIVISPSNKQFIFKDNKYLLGKSGENHNEFDILLFASRDIKEISIPSNIKIISSYAFENCENLTKIEIPKNSKLQTIGSSAFSNSKIEEIYFPTNLKELKEGWCNETKELTKIIISPSNKQFIFKDNKYLLGKNDENNNEFDILLFASRDIKEIFIPPDIQIISSYAFENCENLTKIEIPKNSKLQTIGSSAFSNSKIEEIYFPTNLKELKEGWCNETKELTKIIISPSNKQFIFKDNKYLLGKNDENNNEFDILLFASRDIKEIFIPPDIQIISSYAFENCKNLIKIEIPPNSNLKIIRKDSFSGSSIKQIFIPSEISKKCRYPFNKCENLIKVEIPTNDNRSNKLSIVPHVDIPIDCSAILSVSISSIKIVIITKDYKLIIGEKKYTKDNSYDFKEQKIMDYYDKVHYPISGFSSIEYDFYMVSEVENGIKTKLVKNDNFLKIGEFNPAAIFCGSSNCAAIDLKGAILYIPDSYDDESNILIKPKNLPYNEKAVEIACLKNFLYVLSSTGKLYILKNNTFKGVKQFKRNNVIQISGIHDHILVLTEEGRVYSKGQNLYVELGTGEKNHSMKFIEISSLKRYKIKSVSAGVNHSLFLTS